MSFWHSELGELTGKAEDAFQLPFDLIPDGTTALAKIASMKNDGDKIKIEWVLSNGPYAGRHVFQTLWVVSDSAPSRHAALNMLMLIYKLFNVSPKHSGRPADEDMAVFINKIAGVKIIETQPNKTTGKQYNNVSEVHPAEGFKQEVGTRLPVDSALSRMREQQTKPDTFVDDELPF